MSIDWVKDTVVVEGITAIEARMKAEDYGIENIIDVIEAIGYYDENEHFQDLETIQSN